MREIKFRGKRIDNGEWVFGKSLIQGEIKGREFVQIENSSFDEFRQWDIHPETVGQFTGLKDKNGVDIYEGDNANYQHVLSNNYKIGTIDYNILNCWFEIDKNTIHLIFLSNIEVIGNIHENKKK